MDERFVEVFERQCSRLGLAPRVDTQNECTHFRSVEIPGKVAMDIAAGDAAAEASLTLTLFRCAQLLHKEAGIKAEVALMTQNGDKIRNAILLCCNADAAIVRLAASHDGACAGMTPEVPGISGMWKMGAAFIPVPYVLQDQEAKEPSKLEKAAKEAP